MERIRSVYLALQRYRQWIGPLLQPRVRNAADKRRHAYAPPLRQSAWKPVSSWFSQHGAGSRARIISRIRQAGAATADRSLILDCA